ncbi:hypothetical protein ACWGHD_19205 [Streptomyces xanthophaeus]
MNDSSRPLTDHDEIELMTVKEIMTRCEDERIGLVHGDRYTPVCQWARSSSVHLGNGSYLLLDCYGAPIDSAASKAEKLRVVRY